MANEETPVVSVPKIAIAIVQKGDSFLLIKRRVREGALLWAFPAGSLLPGKTSSRAAERETLEETSVVCSAVKNLGERLHPDTGKEVVCWLCHYNSGEACIGDAEEVAEVCWASSEKIFTLITTDIFQPVKEAISLIPEELA